MLMLSLQYLSEHVSFAFVLARLIQKVLMVHVCWQVSQFVEAFCRTWLERARHDTVVFSRMLRQHQE